MKMTDVYPAQLKKSVLDAAHAGGRAARTTRLRSARPIEDASPGWRLLVDEDCVVG